MLEVDEDSRLGREMLLGGVRYGAADTPGEDQVADFYEMAVDRLARDRHPALRDFQFRPAGIRIAPQLEILEAGAVRRFRRRRPFLRRPSALAKRGIGAKSIVAASPRREPRASGRDAPDPRG